MRHAITPVLAVLAALLPLHGAAADDALAHGRLLFTKQATPPCATCHTLKAAGATGEIGPSLDELKPDADRVQKAIRNGIGLMPPYTTLNDNDVRALAAYVANVSRGN